MPLGPRLVVAGTRSGVGKTTVATGLMAALSRRGLRVGPAKVGPDFIDPGYHGLATGRPGRNLDLWMSGPDTVAALAGRAAEGTDVLVVEGVMGLFDGAADGSATSTAAVASLLDAPVVLVVDASSMSQSVAAMVHGYRSWDPTVRVGGVVLNMVASDSHEAMLRAALEPVGVPVLGALRRDDALAWRSRHLGLHPVAEDPAGVRASLDRLATVIAARCDLAAVEALARSAPPLPTPPLVGPRRVASVRLAVAAGPAFSFSYPDNLEALAAAGAELVPFDPLVDTAIPDGVGAVVIGGGFPEVFADDLAANEPMLADVAGWPPAERSWAECGGLLWLAVLARRPPHGRRDRRRRHHGRGLGPSATAGPPPRSPRRSGRPARACAATSTTTPAAPRPGRPWCSRGARGPRPAASPGPACWPPTCTSTWPPPRPWPRRWWARRPAPRSRPDEGPAVKKSSVYLSEPLKEALADVARRTGRSEADVIRDAVEREVRRGRNALVGEQRAQRPLPAGPGLVGVGVGPGDPGLITDRARQVLRAADRVVVATVGTDTVGRAEAVVRAAEPDVDVERLVWGTSGDDAVRAPDEAAGCIAGWVDSGDLVAFATLGDPHLWSPWGALRRALHTLRPAAAVSAVPGIMAWQDLAARTATVVADGDQRVVLLSLGDDPSAVAELVGDDATTVVVYRGGRSLPGLATVLREEGRLEGAVVGELLGLPGERSAPLERVAGRPGSYLATTIVPAVRRPG